MFKIYGEPESPKEKACLRYKIELANNIHTRDRMSGPANSETLNLELSNFQTLKISSSKLSGLSNFPSRRVSNQTFKLSIFQTLKLAKFHPFQTFDL